MIGAVAGRHHVVENPLPDAPLTVGDSAPSEPWQNRTPGRIGEMPQEQQGALSPAAWDKSAEPLAATLVLDRQCLDNNGP